MFRFCSLSSSLRLSRCVWRTANERDCSTPQPLSLFSTKPSLSFISHVESLPHPEKIAKGGEDGHFVTETCLGVADGVGGWADQGVDPGLYAKRLMELAREKSMDVRTLPQNAAANFASDFLTHAHRHTQHRGSCTAALVALKGGQYHIGNLGDSFITIFRPHPANHLHYEPVFRSIEQFHYFNCPYQLSSEATSDPVTCGQYSVMDAQAGDIVILGTDGVSDNLFHEQICHVIQDGISKQLKNGDWKSVTKTLCHDIAHRSVLASKQEKIITPFSLGAMISGLEHSGGKPDDVTLVLGVVVTQ